MPPVNCRRLRIRQGCGGDDRLCRTWQQREAPPAANITDAALSRLGVEELLAELLDRTCDLLSADTAVVLLLDCTATELITTAAKGLEGEVRQGFRLRVGTDSPATADVDDAVRRRRAHRTERKSGSKRTLVLQKKSLILIYLTIII